MYNQIGTRRCLYQVIRKRKGKKEEEEKEGKRKEKNESSWLFRGASVIWSGRETHSGSALTQVMHTHTHTRTHVYLPFVSFPCTRLRDKRASVYTCACMHREPHATQHLLVYVFWISICILCGKIRVRRVS